MSRGRPWMMWMPYSGTHYLPKALIDPDYYNSQYRQKEAGPHFIHDGSSFVDTANDVDSWQYVFSVCDLSKNEENTDCDSWVNLSVLLGTSECLEYDDTKTAHNMVYLREYSAWVRLSDTANGDYEGQLLHGDVRNRTVKTNTDVTEQDDMETYRDEQADDDDEEVFFEEWTEERVIRPDEIKDMSI